MGWRRVAAAATLLCASVLFGIDAYAQRDLRAAPLTAVTVQTLPSRAVPARAVKFDPVKATDAYLGRVSGAARKRSDAYFEGGYWLILVDGFYAVGAAALLLWTGLSARMGNAAQRINEMTARFIGFFWRLLGMSTGARIAERAIGSRFLHVTTYVSMLFVGITALTFPLTVYEGFFREHAYGLSNQDFAQWFRDFGVGFVVQLVTVTIVLTLIYAVIRAAKRMWWGWGTLVTVILFGCFAMAGPVFVSPLFNHYYPLAESPIKEKILSLARANNIPVDNVYEFDASKQSKRISANVSGLFGTTRISLNDNLMNRSTPAEIQAVVGHEMGHYVLSHVIIGITWFGQVILVAFLFLDRGYRALVNVFGGNWDVRSIDDPAGLPVFFALTSAFLVLATPVTNTISRTLEAQADIFGLNAARQPDGFATATLKLGEYRKLDPSPIEEFIFYDHPSGRTRIMNAMRWKLWHLNDPDIKAGPVSPQ